MVLKYGGTLFEMRNQSLKLILKMPKIDEVDEVNYVTCLRCVRDEGPRATASSMRKKSMRRPCERPLEERDDWLMVTSSVEYKPDYWLTMMSQY